MTVEIDRWKEWHIIAVEGKFVVKSLTRIRQVFETIEKEKSPKAALDLTHTSHLDSSAITIMLNFQKRLLAKGGRLVVFGANDDIMGIFSIVGFDSSVPIYRSRQTFEQTVAT